jgi:hypothetical protein
MAIMTRSAFAKAENLPGRTINYLPTQEEHRSVPTSTRKVKPQACKTRASKPRACKTRASMPRACKSKTDQNEAKPGRTVNHISREIPSDFLDNLSLNTTMFVTRNIDPDILD